MALRGLVRISGAVQHYEWGGYDYIPSLLGVENRAHRPFAELWLGTHPAAPATAEVAGETIPLDRLVELPYLFKVLDARRMLSIQAHPNRAQAAAGFARENAAGIPLTAPHRNYRDENHKPEIAVALTDIWMLHGFRPWEQVAEMRALMPEARSMRELYGAVMNMPQDRVDAVLERLTQRLERQQPRDKDHPDYWALRAVRDYPRDRGIFSIYLLNLLHLLPGQGTYQPAGVLHAYLEGSMVELMANSDNVLRGGLTPKHVDPAELMLTVRFDCGVPVVLEGERGPAGETVYRTTAAEFQLSRIEAGRFAGTSRGPDTLLALEGLAEVRCGEEKLELRRGQSVLIPAGFDFEVTGSAVLYRATLPTSK